MNNSVLTQERLIGRRTIAVFLLIELAIVVGLWTLSPQRMLLIGGAIGGGLLVLLLPVWPQILFPMLVAATALDVTGTIGQRSMFVALTIFHIAWGATLIYCVAYILFKKRTLFPRLELTLPLILFLSLNALSVLYSPAKLGGTIYSFRLMALSTLIYMAVLLIEDRKWVILTISAVILFGVAMAVLGIFEVTTDRYVLPASLVRSMGANIPRAAGTFHNPNRLGAFLMAGVVLSVALFANLKMPWWGKLSLLIAITTLGVGLIVSFSRANWVAAMIGFFCIAVLSRKLKLLVIISVIFLVIIGIISIISADFSELVFGRFISIFETLSKFGSSSMASSTSRIQLVVAAFKMFLDHPFLGIGARGFPVLFDQYKPLDFPIWLMVRESHTLFATILAELGAVGFAISLWLVAVVLKTGIQSLRSIRDEYLKAAQVGLVAVFIGYQVSMCFSAAIGDNFFWVMIGMLFAVKRVGEKTQTE